MSYIVFAKSLICIISNEVWHIVMRYITNSRHKTFCDKTEEVAAAYYLGWINICPSFHPLAKVWYSIYTLQRFTYMLVPNSNGWRKALVVNIRHMDLPSVTFITLHLEKFYKIRQMHLHEYEMHSCYSSCNLSNNSNLIMPRLCHKLKMRTFRKILFDSLYK